MKYHIRTDNVFDMTIEELDELNNNYVKKYVCENGDCSNKKIKVLPFISFITVNAIIGLTFGMFCYHIIF